jgi:NAD(P)-dependent dehydrogenase (short-subunit alcohol dehydrogenase family)
VLGGTSGIGFAVAQLAAGEGAHVVVASSSQARVDGAVARLGSACSGDVVDLRDEAGIEAFFAGVGAIDHLVYTAGEPLLARPLAELSLADAQAFFQVRFWGAFLAVKHAAPMMPPDGSIVLSSGMASRRSRPGWAAVSSVCGATEALTRALAVELAPIRVNAVVPGTVRTELWDALPPAAREGVFTRADKVLPLKRPGAAEEAAEAYLFLMKSGFTTGETVVVDGGASVG